MIFLSRSVYSSEKGETAGPKCFSSYPTLPCHCQAQLRTLLLCHQPQATTFTSRTAHLNLSLLSVTPSRLASLVLQVSSDVRTLPRVTVSAQPSPEAPSASSLALTWLLQDLEVLLTPPEPIPHSVSPCSRRRPGPTQTRASPHLMPLPGV